jgi:thiol-disulfide isomerase/thioredoxin
MKSGILLVGLIVLGLSTVGQSNQAREIRALEIGDTLPNFTIKEVNNFAASQINQSSLKGKWTIIDFWAPYCTSCIAAFPKLDSLQLRFKDSVQFFLVTTMSKKWLDSADAAKNTRQKYKLPKHVASITGDTLLNKLFKHDLLPHLVWIDPKGQVSAVTESADVNEMNISGKINNSGTILPIKTELIIDPSQSLSVQLINDSGKTLPKYYSNLFPGIANIVDFHLGWVVDSIRHTITITKVNLSLLELYTDIFSSSAYGDAFNSPQTDYGKRVVLNVRDSSQLFEHILSQPLQKKGLNKNLFIYDAVMPMMSMDSAYQYYLQDINRYFGLHMKREKRRMKCLILSLANSNVITKFRSTGKSFEMYYDDNGTYNLTSGFMFTLRAELSKANRKSPYVFLDETGAEDRISIKLKSSLNDIPNVKRELLDNYGIVIKQEERPVEVMVIEDENK